MWLVVAPPISLSIGVITFVDIFEDETQLHMFETMFEAVERFESLTLH